MNIGILKENCVLINSVKIVSTHSFNYCVIYYKDYFMHNTYTRFRFAVA